jgi:hypothetical protein
MDEQRKRLVADLVDEFREVTKQLRPLERLQREERRAQGPRGMKRQPRAPKIPGVTVRCKPCSRSLGHHAPGLAVLERVEGPRPWQVREMATWGRAFAEPGSPRPNRILSPVGYQDVSGNGIQLACRRCRHKPRVSLRDLCGRADRALAEGQAYFYL